MPQVYDTKQHRVHPRAVYGVPEEGPADPNASVEPAPSPEAPAYNEGPETQPSLWQLKQARAIEISTGRTAKMFKWVSPRAMAQAPYTLTYTSTKPDESLTYVVNDALQFFTTIYGDEQVGAQLATYLIGNESQQKQTQEMLATLADTPSVYTVGQAATSEEAAQGLLEDTLKDPDTWGKLSASQQSAVSRLASNLLERLQTLPPNDQLGQQLQKAIAVGQDGYSVVLTPEQVQTLTRLHDIAVGNTGGAPGTTDDLDSDTQAKLLGIDQVRRQGGGVLVLDMEWAQANPAQAYAIQEFLEARFPDTTIQYGREGIVGSVLDKLNIAVDYITAPVGAALRQASELGDKSNPEMVAWADEAMRQVSTGYVSPEVRKFMVAGGGVFGDPNDTGDVMRFLARVRDENTRDFGWDAFMADTRRGASPKSVGFGFADNVMRAAQLYPGDPNYGLAYAATGLLAQIVADPLNFGLPALGGLRASGAISRVANAATFGKLGGAGGTIPKLHGIVADIEEVRKSIQAADPTIDLATATERAQAAVRNLGQAELIPQVSRSWIEQQVFTNFARFPEELATSRPFLRAQKKLWEAKQAAGSAENFANVLVQTGTYNARQARLLAGAKSEADMGLALTTDMLGIGQRALTKDQLDSIATRLATSTDEGERAFLTSVLEGSDAAPTLHGVIGGRRLRRVIKASKTPESTVDKVIAAAADSVRRFPSSLFGDSQRLARRGLNSTEDTVATRRMFGEFRNLWRPTGANSEIVFPFTSKMASMVADNPALAARLATAPDQSLQDIIDIARYLGHDEAAIGEFIKPWVNGLLDDDPVEAYRWLKDTWRGIVDDSPKLTLIGKKDLRDLFHTAVGERVGGRLRDGKPAIWRELEDEITGLPYESSMPSIGADMLQGVRLPSLQSLREHATMAGRWSKRWETAGQPRHAVSAVHQAIAAGWRATNAVWRGITLGTRLFVALPARIVGEQMFRLAAFDHASLVSHPFEWFASTTRGLERLKDSDIVLFANSPVHALGTIVQDQVTNPNVRLALSGKLTVELADQAPYYRSYSTRISQFFASKDVHNWRLIDGEIVTDPAEVLRRMHANTDIGPMWAKHIAGSALSQEEVAARWVDELSEVVGTGPGSEYVKTAIARGSVSIDGKLFTAGSKEFAEKLQELAARGDWTPGIKMLPREAGDYVPANRFGDMVARTRDYLFRYMYSAPDLASSRIPLYRQIADREYNNLLKFGYSPQVALETARAKAAERTADILFSLGTHTSGEYLVKAIAPFFPAWRELFDTWLLRIPSRIGRLGDEVAWFRAPGWAMGATELGARVQRYLNFFKNVGIVQTDENGDYVAVPGFDAMVRFFTGSDAKFETRSPLSTFAGVFPLPDNLNATDEEGKPLPWSKRLSGLLPTIGGASVLTLSALKNRFPEVFGDVEDWVTLFGTDTSFGPIAVDRLWEAATNGDPPPWVSGATRTAHEAMWNFAVIDGMRLAFNESPPPDGTDPAEYRKWAEGIVRKGERYAQGSYLLKSITGSVLPFSISMTDEDKAQISAMWDVVNHLPDGTALDSVVISSVLATYPNLDAYMAGKTIDTRTTDTDGEDIDAFMQAVKDGTVKVRSPQDWVVFAFGATSYAAYRNRVEAIKADAGVTPGEVIMNFDNREEVARLRAEWDDFLERSKDEFVLQGQTQSFADMWEQYQRSKQAQREGRGNTLDVEQRQLLDFDRVSREYAKYFSINPASADEYFKLKQAAYDSLEGTESNLMQGVSWWWDHVSDPYYDKLDKLYTQLGEVNDTQKPLVYQKIRELANRYDKEWADPRWEGTFPSPEEYSFAKLNPQEKADQTSYWASLPPEFLTSFQRSQVGYEGDEAGIEKFVRYQSKTEYRVRKWLDDHDIGTTTTQGQQVLAAMEAQFDKRAEELGVSDFRKLSDVPAYKRIAKSLGYADNEGWKFLMQQLDTIKKWGQAKEFSLGGDTYYAEYFREQFNDLVTWFRDPKNGWPSIDNIFYDLQRVIGGEHPLTQSDLVAKLFFETSDFTPLYELDKRKAS